MAPVFLDGNRHHGFCRSAVEAFVLLSKRLDKGAIFIPLALVLQFREHLRRLHNTPALRIVFKFLLSGEHFTYRLVKRTTFYLGGFPEFSCEPFEDETWHQR